MSDLFDLLQSQLGGQVMGQIGRQIGADQGSLEQALPSVLGSLMGGLARNANQGNGAAALSNALDRDHDGSILDDLGGFVQGADSGAGAGILGHVFGAQRPKLEAQLSQQTGLDAGQIAGMLTTLAPVVLGALGKAKRSQGLDSTGLASMLEREAVGIERKAPQGLGILGSLLDADGDGNIADDLAKQVGKGLLGKILGK